MATINLAFRADVNSSVCILGDLTDDLVSKIAPEVLRLRASGNPNVTVFINSNGGSIRCLDHLWGLLSSKAAQKPSRIITVAIGNAKSASATLLALGNYAIAYPKASIHFHGVRYGEVEDVTMETASLMAAQLQNTNIASASLLSKAGTQRLAFHYARLKNQFPEIRKDPKSASFSDIECFSECLKSKLSNQGDRIVDNAIERWKYLQALSEQTVAKVRRLNPPPKNFEASVLHKVIDFEVKRNKRRDPDWCLNGPATHQVLTEYLLLRDYDIGRHISLVRSLYRNFKHAFFTTEEIEQLDKAQALPLDDRSHDQARMAASGISNKTLKPFCYFASSIWQGLHEDENPLSPKDAYWLGAIDEVYDSNLPCLRQIAESQSADQGDLDFGAGSK